MHSLAETSGATTLGIFIWGILNAGYQLHYLKGK
jgi:hypothetical protein